MSTEEQFAAVEEKPAPTSVNSAGAIRGVDGVQKMKEAKLASERKRSRGLGEDKSFKLFSGTANRPLAEEIAGFVGVKLGESKLQRFADGEVYFQLLENVRGTDVFLIQPTCFPVDKNMLELLIIIDALKRASAG